MDYKVIFDHKLFSSTVSMKRLGMKLTKKKLAEVTGISVYHITSLEDGKPDIVIDFVAFASLCVFLDISMDRYFTKQIDTGCGSFKIKRKHTNG
jgi:transcriptional regulator with XRE-family HTH domain